jgi:hypothetical protein
MRTVLRVAGRILFGLGLVGAALSLILVVLSVGESGNENVLGSLFMPSAVVACAGRVLSTFTGDRAHGE